MKKKLIIYSLIVGALCGFQILTTNAVTVSPNIGGTGTSTLPSLGALLVGQTSTNYGVLGVGSNGQSLLASSTAPLGVAWGTVTQNINASTTFVTGTNGVSVVQVGVNATASLNTTYQAIWTALETFNAGLTSNATTTLASTTNALLVTNGSGTVLAFAGSNPCSAGQAAVSISATGTIGCASTIVSPLIIPGNATTTIYGSSSGNSNTSDSYIPQLNGIFTVPLDYATNGCNGSSTLTDFGGCVNSLYANAPSSPWYIGIYVPAGLNVPSSTWKTPIVFGNYGILVSFDCPGGAQLHYGGTGAAVTFNSYDSEGHERSQDYGCTYMGHDTAIHGGQTNTATTTGVVFGGPSGQNNGLGAVGIDFHDNTINGFGVDEYHGAVNYMFTSDNNSYSGWNGGGTISVYSTNVNGAGVYIAQASNSNENMAWLNDTVTDGGNSTSSYGYYIHDNAGPKINITGGSIDDAQVYEGAVNDLNISNVWFENPDFTDYLGYAFIYAAASSNSSLNVSNNQFFNGASTAPQNPPEFIEEAVANANFIDNYFDEYNGETVTKAIDHSIGASIPNEIFCGNHNQGSAYTNLANQLPDSVASQNAGCWSESANSYAIGMLANGNNTNSFYSGSTVAGSYDHSGNWTFLNTIKVTPATPSYIADNNTILAVPTNYSSVGVTNSSTATDLGSAVNWLYTQDAQSSTVIQLPAGHFTYSTGINQGTNGHRELLEGAPGGGTVLTYTGSGCAITINTGTQAAGIDHTTGGGVYGISLYGNNTATSTAQKGICSAGANGSDGTVINLTNVYGFGYGLYNSSNTYHWLFENGTVRNNGYNFFQDAPSNSGEGIQFLNAFIVDGANNNPNDCFYVTNSGAASMNISGGSFDDCQMHILQANDLTISGTHFENPGYSAWGKYNYINIDNNTATNVDINGAVFYNDANAGGTPTTFISNGGTLTLNGVITRQFGGQTVTSFVTTSGSGRTSWIGFNDVSGTSVSNVVDSLGLSSVGSTATSSWNGTVQVLSNNLVDASGNKYSTSTSSGSGSVTTSSAITVNDFPYWTTTAGGLNGTSSLITSGGNIGVGATNSNFQFNVEGSQANGNYEEMQIKNNASSGWSEYSLGNDQGDFEGFLALGGSTSSNPNSVQLGASLNAPLLFWTNNLVRATIGKNGNTVFGSNASTNFSPTSTVQIGGSLQVTQTSTFAQTSTFNGNVTPGPGNNLKIVTGDSSGTNYFEVDNSQTQSQFKVFSNGTTIQQGTSTILGNQVIGTTTFSGNAGLTVNNGYQAVGPAPTLGTCGSGSTMNTTSNNTDQYGTINTAGTVTSCVMNFATPYPWGSTIPSCNESDNSTAITGDVSTVSSSSVTFSFSISLGSGQIYYHCN